jgi:hypothetical protein
VFSTDTSTCRTRICYPIAADDSTSQPLSDSKHWESKCSKDLERLDINARPKAQEMLQLWTEGSLRQFMPQPTFTSSFDTGSYFSTTVQPQWKLYPGPSSTELRSRKSKPSGYGGSSKHPNNGVWYIARQFHSMLIISYILFFSVPENLGMRFLLRG